MARTPKIVKLRPRFLALLSELMLHPVVVVDSVEVRPLVNVGAVRSAAKRAGLTLHPQVASLMAELPWFCVEWHADVGDAQVRGGIALLHERRPDEVRMLFGLPTAPTDLMVLDYGLSDNVDGVVLHVEGGAIGPQLSQLERGRGCVATSLVASPICARRGPPTGPRPRGA